MKKARRVLRTLGHVLAPFLLGGLALAQDEPEISSWYFHLSTGVADIKDVQPFDTDTAYLLSGAVGYRLVDAEHFWLGLEGEALYSRANIADSTSEVKLHGFYGNAVVDWRLYEKFGLYGAGGFGWDKVKALDEDESGFGFQLKAGVRYSLAETLDLTMGYRYQSVEETSANDGDVHAFELGLTWNLYKPSLIR